MAQGGAFSFGAFSEEVTSILNESDFLDAVEKGDIDKVKKLVTSGVNVNATFSEKTPGLIYECRGYVPCAVRALVQAEVNDNGCKDTALIHAVGTNQTEMCELLLHAGADANIRGFFGLFALHYAATLKNLYLVKLLLEKGAQINAAGYDGETPIFWAVSMGNVDVIQLLLEHGAGVNIARNDGVTAFHFAAVNGQLVVVKLLVQHCAHINSRASNGRTPLGDAIDEYQTRVSTYLRSIGATE